MRQIKYRAFLKNKKFMVDVASIGFNGYITWNDWRHTREIEPSPLFEVEWIDDVILMQYTWLQDKNWNEIYEGDVVKSLWTIFRVDYDMDWFYAVNGEEYASLNSYTWLNDPYDIDDVEIIWNIYEHPNLLK